MDINNFKLINLFNHEEGDKAITRVGYLLRKCTTHLHRSKLFRSGGDEFVFFSENKEDIYLFINKVIEELDTLELIDNKIKVTLSFGIGKSYVDADNALLLAKKRKAEITYPIHDLLE
jgi:GGDEF domain-containing protein